MKHLRTARRKNPLIGALLVLLVLAGAWLVFGGRSLVKDLQWQAEGNPEVPLAFSPDRKLLVRGGDPVRLYDAASGKLLLTLPTPNDGSSVSRVAVSPKGDVVACARRSAPGKEPLTRKAEFFDAKTGAKLAELDVTAGAFAFSPDGTMIVTASPKVEFWSLPGFKPIAAALPPAGIFGGEMAFSRDGKLLAVAGYVWVEIIDIKTMTQAATLTAPDAEAFCEVAFWPDGKTVVAAAHWKSLQSSKSSGVWAWDLATKQVKWHKEFGKSMTGASLSADGQTLAVTLSGYDFLSPKSWMQVWDLKTRRKIGEKEGFGWRAIALSEDGNRLAVGFGKFNSDVPPEIQIWKVE